MSLLDATVGGASANSFATVAEMDAWNGLNPLASGWAALSETEKEQYGIRATMGLEIMPEAWTGGASTETQALGWPRTGMYSRNGFAIAIDVVPIDLKNAESEYANQLRIKDLFKGSVVQDMGITSVKMGPMAATFRDPLTSQEAALPSQRANAGMVPAVVRLMLVPSWLKTVAEQQEEERADIVFEAL
jgi:hypothetical protein